MPLDTLIYYTIWIDHDSSMFFTCVFFGGLEIGCLIGGGRGSNRLDVQRWVIPLRMCTILPPLALPIWFVSMTVQGCVQSSLAPSNTGNTLELSWSICLKNCNTVFGGQPHRLKISILWITALRETVLTLYTHISKQTNKQKSIQC